ncbi:MAG: hypothetical protein II875_05485 [Clostridia bacterium]|nr:hypothetical protein [Clostridia bacterium]
MKRMLSLLALFVCAALLCASPIGDAASAEEAEAAYGEDVAYGTSTYTDAPEFILAEAVLSLGTWVRITNYGSSPMADLSDDFRFLPGGEMIDCEFYTGDGRYAALVTSAGEEMYLTFIASDSYGTKACTYNLTFNYDRDGSYVFMVLSLGSESLVYRLER